jgi:hypothetical protein
MAAARTDWDIAWILLLAAVCGTAIWKHQELTTWLSSAWTHRFWLF